MSSHNDAINIRASSADGTLLRFSTDLLNFLAKRGRGRAFHLSDWLQSLDEERLAHLRQLADTALHDAKSIGIAVEDLLSVVIHALAAERRVETVSFSEAQIGEYVSLLGLLATLERLRRKGLLTYESFMSIELDAANAVVLDKNAMGQAGDIETQIAQIKRNWH